MCLPHLACKTSKHGIRSCLWAAQAQRQSEAVAPHLKVLRCSAPSMRLYHSTPRLCSAAEAPCCCVLACL